MYHGRREWYSFMHGVGGSVVACDGAFQFAEQNARKVFTEVLEDRRFPEGRKTKAIVQSPRGRVDSQSSRISIYHATAYQKVSKAKGRQQEIGDKGNDGGRTGETTSLPCNWMTLSKEISHICGSYVEYLVASCSRSREHVKFCVAAEDSERM